MKRAVLGVVITGLLLLSCNGSRACDAATCADCCSADDRCISCDSVEACTVAPVQGLSQSCCEARGIDACGAGLFCAAFDGRTVPTCYANNSRLGLEECTADAHCASSQCNVTLSRCKSIGSETCRTDVGCAVPQGYSSAYCTTTSPRQCVLQR